MWFQCEYVDKIMAWLHSFDLKFRKKIVYIRKFLILQFPQQNKVTLLHKMVLLNLDVYCMVQA